MESDEFDDDYLIDSDHNDIIVDVDKNDGPKDIIKNNNNEVGQNFIAQDKEELVKLGYPKATIDLIYKNICPVNIDEALDYLYKNSMGQYIHTYIPNSQNKCAICEEISSNHVHPIKKELDEVESQRSKVDSHHMNYNVFQNVDMTCKVCESDLEVDDFKIGKLRCNHFFCRDCWFDYLKNKINNGKTFKITCMQAKCTTEIKEDFVRKIIQKDQALLEKYERFAKNNKLLMDSKNTKFCPFPDCDGYAVKSSLSKYVKCTNGHEFCFNCSQKPHGWKACSTMIDKGFEEWKSQNLVKRCPYCRFWTEKNTGCNHMTCSQCNFQWCWVCEKECVAGHYLFGTCAGLHFSDVNKKGDASRLLCHNCGPYCIVSYIIMKIVFLIIYLTMMPYFYLVVLMSKDDEYHDCNCEGYTIPFYGCFLPFFIAYEIMTICWVAVLSIPSIIIWPYYRLLRYIFYGKIFGVLFSV